MTYVRPHYRRTAPTSKATTAATGPAPRSPTRRPDAPRAPLLGRGPAQSPLDRQPMSVPTTVRTVPVYAGTTGPSALAPSPWRRARAEAVSCYSCYCWP